MLLNGVGGAQFAPQGPGDGGFALIPGSHKSAGTIEHVYEYTQTHLVADRCNVPCPRSMSRYEKYQEYVHQPVCEAGDAVIFCEVSSRAGVFPRVLLLARR